MAEKKGKKKKGGQNVKIYGRVRSLMPWEPRKVSLFSSGNKLRNVTEKRTNEYSFAKVFNTQVTNEQIFKVMVEPMIDNVLNGFNAVLIAYGQTGSGKTFSMLGKPKLNVIGLLPYMLKTMVESENVLSVKLKAVEAFGHHVARIELFDLFNPENQTLVWGDKFGNTSLEMSDATEVAIGSMEDAYDQIRYAHHASHFAPTGKNPESSRGHVSFVAEILQKDPSNPSAELKSYFVMVDLAGSEGESAFTPEFKASIDQTTLMARRLEAGTINTGLSSLQIIFNELKKRGKLSKMRGNGLRRVLHNYINTQTFLSVLFTFSPSVNNAKPTESTLKFAVTAGMVKVSPVKQVSTMNMDKVVENLRKAIAENDKIIEEQNDKITDLNMALEKLKQDAMSSGQLPADFEFIESEDEDEAGDSIGPLKSGKRKKRKKGRANSNLPSSLLAQLQELDEESSEDEFDLDDMFKTEVEGGQVDEKALQAELDSAYTQNAKTNQGGTLIQHALGTLAGAESSKAGSRAAMEQLASTLQAASADPSLGRYEFEMTPPPVEIDFGEMNKDDLVNLCTESFGEIEENRETQKILKKKQHEVVGHLVETNEWLFNTLNDIMNET